MVVKSAYDLITNKRCFDIHREPFCEIEIEMFTFVNVLKKVENYSQDSYCLADLYKHSFDVLEQILDEYFKYYERKIKST